MRNREIEKVPFRSALTKYRNIENRNKAFNKLSKKSKRREIAFDALKLVQTSKIKPARGEYWNEKLESMRKKAQSPKEFQKCLINLPASCECCQRGLMMVSQIRLGNTVDPNDEDADSGNHDNIKGFDYQTFRDMEREFENSNYNHPYPLRSKRKLANICCNIIVNGDFKTGDTTDYLTKWKLTIKG